MTHRKSLSQISLGTALAALVLLGFPGGSLAQDAGGGGQTKETDACATKCAPDKKRADETAAAVATAKATLARAEAQNNRDHNVQSANELVDARYALKDAQAKADAAQASYQACLERLKKCPNPKPTKGDSNTATRTTGGAATGGQPAGKSPAEIASALGLPGPSGTAKGSEDLEVYGQKFYLLKGDSWEVKPDGTIVVNKPLEGLIFTLNRDADGTLTGSTTVIEDGKENPNRSYTYTITPPGPNSPRRRTIRFKSGVVEVTVGDSKSAFMVAVIPTAGGFKYGYRRISNGEVGEPQTGFIPAPPGPNAADDAIQAVLVKVVNTTELDESHPAEEKKEPDLFSPNLEDKPDVDPSQIHSIIKDLIPSDKPASPSTPDSTQPPSASRAPGVNPSSYQSGPPAPLQAPAPPDAPPEENPPNAGDQPPAPPPGPDAGGGNPRPRVPPRPPDFKHAVSIGPNTYQVTICRGTDYVLPINGPQVSVTNIQNGPSSNGGPPSALGGEQGNGLNISGRSVGTNQIDADVVPSGGGDTVHITVKVNVIDCDPPRTTVPPPPNPPAVNPANPGNPPNGQQPGDNPPPPGQAPAPGGAPPGGNPNPPNPGDQPPATPPGPGAGGGNPPPRVPPRPPDFKHPVPIGPNTYQVTICRGTDYVLPINGPQVSVTNIQNGPSSNGGPPSALGGEQGNGLNISGRSVGTNQIDADVVPSGGGDTVHITVKVNVIDCDPPRTTVPPPPNPPAMNPADLGILPDQPEPGAEPGDSDSMDPSTNGVLFDLASVINSALPTSTETGFQLFVVVVEAPTTPAAPGGTPAQPSPESGAAQGAGNQSRLAASHFGARLLLAGFHPGVGPGLPTPAMALPGAIRARPSRSPGTQASGGVAYSIVSNGKSSGEAFELRVLDTTGKVKRIRVPEGLVLEPVKRGAAKPVSDHAPPGAKVHTRKLSAFCLEFAKPPPDEGMLYRVAPQAAQEQYRPIRGVLRAGREAAAAGKFHPDSDPKEYAETIRQYALWAKLGNWNEQKFTEMFLERSKKNAEAMNVKWTKQLEQALRGLVPGRWGDVSMVLQEAEKLQGAGARPGAE